MNEFEMLRLLRIAGDMNPFVEDELTGLMRDEEKDSLSEEDLELVSAAGSKGMDYQQFMRFVQKRGNKG